VRSPPPPPFRASALGPEGAGPLNGKMLAGFSAGVGPKRKLPDGIALGSLPLKEIKGAP
jgi:hypothetical protein